MITFDFYTNQYLGEYIPEEQFLRYARRAGKKLDNYRVLYGIRPRPAVFCAKEFAQCAIADAMYEFDQEDARRGFLAPETDEEDGSYTAPAELSATTLYLRERYFRDMASDFLVLGKL